MKRILAVLLAATLALPLSGCGETPAAPQSAGRAAVAQLAAAVYPETAPYPDEANYFKPNGELSDDFDKAYDAWWADVRARRSQPEGYADGLDGFLTDSIRQFLSGAEGENRVYSPLNVCLALAMLAELTGGESRAQILTLLGSDSIEALRAQAKALWSANYINDGATSSLLASSLWLSRDVSFLQPTMDSLAENYYASSYQGEMGSGALNKALRDWLNDNTGGLLEEQAGGVTLDVETILALATAIYFRARWGSEFSGSATEPDVFHAPGGDVTVEFMHQGGSDAYYWGESFSAVAKRLESGGAMLFLLPDEGATPETLLDDAEAMSFLLSGGSGWENSKYLIVNKSIPKFDAVSDLDLIPGLKALGITDAFNDQRSDFSPMTTDMDGVYVSQARHAARVTIDEEGVVAAAYTVMAMNGSGMPPEEEIDFVVDRPFLFVITGTDNLPLFAGIVNTP